MPLRVHVIFKANEMLLDLFPLESFGDVKAIFRVNNLKETLKGRVTCLNHKEYYTALVNFSYCFKLRFHWTY